MNKKLLATLSIAALIIGAGVVLTNKKTINAEAYSGSSLTKNIDLNDNTPEEIRSYYSDLNSLSESERKGTNLLKNLKPILSDGQKYYSYDTAKDNIWKMYEIIDRDWVKSRKEDIVGYNQSTNTITNYSYKSTNPYIHALYVNRDVENQTTAWDDHQQTQWGINQEHIWPKSQGFNQEGAGGARGDPMHLWAGNGRVNGTEHNNHPYGYVDKTQSYTDPVKAKGYSNLSKNYSGTSLTLGTGTVFEPQDSDKGDIARAVFYMVARYNNYAGNDNSIDANNPNLELVQSAPELASYTATSTKTGKMGILSDLLEWNELDPPDAWEIHRNNLLYNNYTNNRNPFIDFPSWANYIWGNQSQSADPSTDSISSFDKVEVISVESVSLPASETIAVDSTITLVPTFTPSNATNKAVTWSSNKTGVATVSSSGVVTGVSAGEATITVRTSDGNKVASCVVTVQEEEEDPNVRSIIINYDDTFSPTFPTSSGTVNTTDTSHTDTTAGFSFKEQGIYKNSNYLMFKNGAGFLYNTTNLGTIDSVTLTYSADCSKDAKVGIYFGTSEQSTYTTTGNIKNKGKSQSDKFTNNVEGNGYFQLSTSAANCQITDIVIKYHPYMTSISLTDQKTEFILGDEFEFGGTVTANYTDGNSYVVTDDATFTGYDPDELGEQTITVSYTNEKGTTVEEQYTIEVIEINTVDSISLSSSSLRFDLNEETTTHQLFVDMEITGTHVDTSVTWESSDPAVASVSNSGLVTANSVGNATITATSVFDNSMSASCSVTVVDSSIHTDEVTDVLTKATTGVAGSTYTEWSGKVATSSAVYAGFTAGSYSSIQLKSKSSNSGIISTTSGGKLKSVSVVWNTKTESGRTINIYGSTTPYSEVSDLYSDSTKGTLLGSITYGTSTTLDISGEYQYIGIRSSVNAVYLDEISITWTGEAVIPPDPPGPVDPPVSESTNSPYVNGVAYKLSFHSTNDSNDYYFAGSMNGYYGATSTSYDSGTDVYFEQNGDDQNLYFIDGSKVKQYIYIELSNNHINFKFKNKVPELTWHYDDVNECIYMNADSENPTVKYTIGTYGTYNTFGAFNLTSYPDNYKPEFSDTAHTIAYYLLYKITCDGTGKTGPTFADGFGWSDIKDRYDALNEVSPTQAAKILTSEKTIYVDAIERYDYLVWKYKYENFLGKEISHNVLDFKNYVETSDNIIIYLVIALTSIGVLLPLVILKAKKKEQ